MNELGARARGKVILLGEHAVVYGTPAIAAGIDRGAHAVAVRSERALLSAGTFSARPDDGSDLGRAFAALLAVLEAPPCEVRIELDLPAGCGLGASAAMGAAAALAVQQLGAVAGPSSTTTAATPRELAAVEHAAFEWERVFHGTPSGIDTAAALSGGCIFYTREAGATKLELPEPLKLAVAIAGPAASTKSMIDAVARLRKRRPDVVQKTLDGIAALVKNARFCIESADLHGLGKLMDLNQMLLSGLFVSTEGIELACRVAREAGALGAKLTGAGGGGAVIALSSGDPAPIVDAWRARGLVAFTTEIHGEPTALAPTPTGSAAHDA